MASCVVRAVRCSHWLAESVGNQSVNVWLLYLVLVGADHAGFYDEFPSYDECVAAGIEDLDADGAEAILCIEWPEGSIPMITTTLVTSKDGVGFSVSFYSKTEAQARTAEVAEARFAATP